MNEIKNIGVLDVVKRDVVRCATKSDRRTC